MVYNILEKNLKFVLLKLLINYTGKEKDKRRENKEDEFKGRR